MRILITSICLTKQGENPLSGPTSTFEVESKSASDVDFIFPLLKDVSYGRVLVSFFVVKRLYCLIFNTSVRG